VILQSITLAGGCHILALILALHNEISILPIAGAILFASHAAFSTKSRPLEVQSVSSHSTPSNSRFANGTNSPSQNEVAIAYSVRMPHPSCSGRLLDLILKGRGGALT
jgi:hypothetical protein